MPVAGWAVAPAAQAELPLQRNSLLEWLVKAASQALIVAQRVEREEDSHAMFEESRSEDITTGNTDSFPRQQAGTGES